MPKINILNQSGQVVGELELSNDLFDAEVNEHAVYLSLIHISEPTRLL